MGLRDTVHEYREKLASDGELTKERFTGRAKSLLDGLKYNLVALEEDPETGEKTITADTVKVWVNHGCSFLTGVVTGLGSYWYCKRQFVWFRERNFLYDTGSLESPPSVMYLIISLIWAGFISVAVSLMVVAFMQVLQHVFVTKDMEYRDDIRAVGLALSGLVYVLTIAFLVMVGLPLPELLAR